MIPWDACLPYSLRQESTHHGERMGDGEGRLRTTQSQCQIERNESHSRIAKVTRPERLHRDARRAQLSDQDCTVPEGTEPIKAQKADYRRAVKENQSTLLT